MTITELAGKMEPGTAWRRPTWLEGMYILVKTNRLLEERFEHMPSYCTGDLYTPDWEDLWMDDWEAYTITENKA